MRKLITPLVCVLCALSVAGQNNGTLTLLIHLTDSVGFPIPEAAIRMVEPGMNLAEEFFTNAEGEAEISLTEGAHWVMSIEDMNEYQAFFLPAQGEHEYDMSIVYDNNWRPHMNETEPLPASSPLVDEMDAEDRTSRSKGNIHLSFKLDWLLFNKPRKDKTEKYEPR